MTSGLGWRVPLALGSLALMAGTGRRALFLVFLAFYATLAVRHLRARRRAVGGRPTGRTLVRWHRLPDEADLDGDHHGARRPPVYGPDPTVTPPADPDPRRQHP